MGIKQPLEGVIRLIIIIYVDGNGFNFSATGRGEARMDINKG